LKLKNFKITKILSKKYKAVKIIVPVDDDKVKEIELNNAFG
jgi:hypothetical protein